MGNISEIRDDDLRGAVWRFKRAVEEKRRPKRRLILSCAPSRDPYWRSPEEIAAAHKLAQHITGDGERDK